MINLRGETNAKLLKKFEKVIELKESNAYLEVQIADYELHALHKVLLHNTKKEKPKPPELTIVNATQVEALDLIRTT